jgi:hypothetical protein
MNDFDHGLGPTLDALRDSVRRFAVDQIAPVLRGLPWS